MVAIASNRKAIVAQLDKQVRAKLIEIAYAYERILQEEFRRAKTGTVYGEEKKVSFDAQGGGEKTVKFQVLKPVRSRKSSRKAFKSVTVEFTANKDQEATKRSVSFVVNRGKKWKEGGKNRGMHRASAPGEAPAIQTGALRKGIVHAIKKLGPMRYSVVIGVSIQSGRGGPTTSGRSIAEMLEFGTEHMKPRPGFRIALEKFKRGYRALAAPKKSKG